MRPEPALARLHAKPLNFDERSVSHHRWHVDELSQALPSEPPGEPVHGGAWHVACRLVEDYRIADPAIVRASWEPGAPLERVDARREVGLGVDRSDLVAQEQVVLVGVRELGTIPREPIVERPLHRSVEGDRPI